MVSNRRTVRSSNNAHDHHFLTAQYARAGKNVNDSRIGIGAFGTGGRDEWVLHSGAIFRGTGDPTRMVECKTPK